MAINLQVIQHKIYNIRGIQVMLDFDLAQLYEIPTKALKQAVRRNDERFPEDFMFILTETEWKELVTICDQLPKEMKHSSAVPFAFTEQGVAMLSGILRSSVAVQVNINIMRAFVAMRQLVLSPPENKTERLQHEMKELRQYIEEIFADYNDINEDTRIQIELINQALAELQVKEKLPKERPRIGF